MSTKSKCHWKQFKFTDAPFSPKARRWRQSSVDSATEASVTAEGLRLSQQEEASLPWPLINSKQPSAQRKAWVPSSQGLQTDLGRKSGAQGRKCLLTRHAESWEPWRLSPETGQEGVRTQELHESNGWKHQIQSNTLRCESSEMLTTLTQICWECSEINEFGEFNDERLWKRALKTQTDVKQGMKLLLVFVYYVSY